MSSNFLDRLYYFSVTFFEITETERSQIYADIRDSYQMRPSYLMMLVLACLVAIWGLLANSPAVVIGAMLISPLMNPFLSAGLALAIGDWELGKAAMRTILLSVLAAVFISGIAVAVSPLKEPTAEILARTNPNLLDLGIAFFSGCAGTYTLISRKGLTAIPGVAIATAVMPPLCVVGFGIFQLDARIALGALSLFVTNLAAIIVSAAILFFLASFRVLELKDEKPHWPASTRLIISFVILGLLAVPLALALIHAAEASRLRKKVEVALTTQLKGEVSRARLMGGWTVKRVEDRGLVVEATVRTLTYFTNVEVDTLTRALERTLGEPVDLQLDQIQVRKGGLDPVTTSAPVEPKLLPVTDSVYFSRLSREFQPAVDLCLKTVNAELDRFYLVTDQQAVTQIEIMARVETLPPPDVLAAGQRAARAQIKLNQSSQQPLPAITFYFLPKQPVTLSIRVQKEKVTLDLAQLNALKQTLGGFLAQMPKPGVKIRFAETLVLDATLQTSLHDQIMKKLDLEPASINALPPESQELNPTPQIEILVSKIDDTIL